MAIRCKDAHCPQDSMLMGVRWYVAFPFQRAGDRMVESGDVSAASQRKTGPVREPWHW